MEITVIITAYADAHYVTDAIESVLSQTRLPEELLIVGVQLTDSATQRIEPYERNNAGLITSTFVEQDISIPEMRNIGLSQASGDLITFLDGDDRFRPEKLEQELDSYKAHPEAQVVFSNIAYTDELGTVNRTWCEDDIPPTGFVLYENAMRNWPNDALYRNELVSRSLLESVGLYDENLPIYEDWDLKIRTAARTEVAYCPYPLAEYRQHGESVSSRSPPRLYYETTKYIHDKNEDLFESELSSTEYRQVERAMRAKIYRHDAFASKQENAYRRAIRSYLTLLRTNPSKLADFKMHLRFILPANIYRAIRAVYRQMGNTS